MAGADVGQDDVRGSGHRRPGQSVECGWCGRAVEVPARGRVPSWCSSSCRHRAWEARRAEREQLRDVRVVTRRIEVEKPKLRTVEVAVPAEPGPLTSGPPCSRPSRPASPRVGSTAGT